MDHGPCQCTDAEHDVPLGTGTGVPLPATHRITVVVHSPFLLLLPLLLSVTS